MTVRTNNSRWLLAACLLLWMPALAWAQEAPPGPDASGTSVSEAAQATYQRLIDEKRYDEAVTIAKQLVDLATRLHGERSIELAAPLESLARAQLRTGDLAGAEGNFKASIAVIEPRGGDRLAASRQSAHRPRRHDKIFLPIVVKQSITLTKISGLTQKYIHHEA